MGWKEITVEIRTYLKLINKKQQHWDVSSSQPKLWVQCNNVQHFIRKVTTDWKVLEKIKKLRVARKSWTCARSWDLLDQKSRAYFKIILMKSYCFWWVRLSRSQIDQIQGTQQRTLGHTWTIGVPGTWQNHLGRMDSWRNGWGSLALSVDSESVRN